MLLVKRHGLRHPGLELADARVVAGMGGGELGGLPAAGSLTHALPQTRRLARVEAGAGGHEQADAVGLAFVVTREWQLDAVLRTRTQGTHDHLLRARIHVADG